MTARQFDKKVVSVLERYRTYKIADHRVWKEKNQIFFSVRFEPDLFRKDPWGISAVFDKDGNLIRSSCGSYRDYLFTRILMKRIEHVCCPHKEGKGNAVQNSIKRLSMGKD